ncbi:MAG: DinB family protein, partial [Nevskiales bacterium]
MIDSAYCVLMARYNQWMNRKVYAACAQLTEAQRKEDRGAFFGSIQGTLNHLLYGDTAWMRRFKQRPLDGLHGRMEFHPDLEALRAMRDIFDHEIIDWAAKLQAEWLAADFTYSSIADGSTRTRPAWQLVVHMFNHQTHHRGQVATLLSQFGVDIG